MFKLCFYVPESHLETVKGPLFAHGAGQFNAYDQCCWQILGEGQFRPLPGSQPFLGEADQLKKLAEYKVEMICKDEAIKNVLQALLAVHPYEEPAYHSLQNSDRRRVVMTSALKQRKSNDCRCIIRSSNSK